MHDPKHVRLYGLTLGVVIVMCCAAMATVLSCLYIIVTFFRCENGRPLFCCRRLGTLGITGFRRLHTHTHTHSHTHTSSDHCPDVTGTCGVDGLL